MNELAEKVALRYKAGARGAEELMLRELDPAEIEVYIQGLVDSIDDLEGAEKELGLDLRNMVKLLDKYPHNDDIHHSGETTLVHMKWVLEDLRELSEDKDEQTRQLLNLAALLHDLGKAYSYELRDGKHTFHGHAKLSVKIAEKMLAKLRKKNAKLVERVLDLVRLHDVFMQLINARAEGGGNRKYLNRLMREAIYTEGHLDTLVTLSKADGNRAKRMGETLEGIEGILADLKIVEAERQREMEERKRRAEPPPEVVADVRAILEDHAPDLVGLLPNIKAIKGELGKARRYDVLKLISKVQQ
jgi:putative nucleotidyltransferase with HDIG domain